MENKNNVAKYHTEALIQQAWWIMIMISILQL